MILHAILRVKIESFLDSGFFAFHTRSSWNSSSLGGVMTLRITGSLADDYELVALVESEVIACSGMTTLSSR
jgi:hypothetical protein